MRLRCMRLALLLAFVVAAADTEGTLLQPACNSAGLTLGDVAATRPKENTVAAATSGGVSSGTSGLALHLVQQKLRVVPRRSSSAPAHGAAAPPGAAAGSAMAPAQVHWAYSFLANSSSTVQSPYDRRRTMKILNDITRIILTVAVWHPAIIADILYFTDLDPMSRDARKTALKLGDMLRAAPALRSKIQDLLADPAVVEPFTADLGAYAPFVEGLLTDRKATGALLDLQMNPKIASEFQRALDSEGLDSGVHVWVSHSPVIRSHWVEFMMPDVRFCRNLGIIGNVVIIAVICMLVSTKTQSLKEQKLDKAAPANMEAVMRREITAAELRRHALPGDLWLAVDGLICDITEFTGLHPGGADLLLQHAGTDATEQFKEVGHSEFAVEQIKARVVGVLSESDAVGGHAHSEEGAGCARRIKKFLPAKLLTLFTKEDRFNFHKVLGVTVLAHYIVRFGIVLQGYWLLDGHLRDPMLFNSDWFSLASVWFCALLQITSFQFVLPRNRVLGRPMLWQEWRAHNLIFVSRNLVAFTATWALERYYSGSKSGQNVMTGVTFAAVFCQLYFADVASRALRDSKHESLTASWPLWEGCPLWVERFLKFYYSIGINQLTGMVLSSGVGPTYAADFGGIIILQSDSFAMTLVRKNIISTPTFHGFYLWNMWHLAFLVQHTSGRMLWKFGDRTAYWLEMQMTTWGVPVAVYLLRFFGLSKYGCWVGYMVKILLDINSTWQHKTWLACPVVWAAWALGQRLSMGYVFEYRVRRFLEGGRSKPLVLKGRERVTRSLYLLSFEMPAGYACGMMPGQHCRLLTPNISKGMRSWNGMENLEIDASDLSRSYTPTSPPDSKTFEILVKHYPKDEDSGFPQGGRASTYLIEELKVGMHVLAAGPHGQRIYFGNGFFEVEVGKPKMRPRICAVLAGGSGITPAIAVIREVQAEARRKAFKSEAWRLMDYDNEFGIEAFTVIHANRSAEDALPPSFYDDPFQKQQLVPIYVRNIATGRAENHQQIVQNDDQREAQCKWSMQYSKLTKEVIGEAFPTPGDDVLCILCGPHSFIVDFCQPLMKELGFEHIIAMW